jgi:hypothetical protein
MQWWLVWYNEAFAQDTAYLLHNTFPMLGYKNLWKRQESSSKATETKDIALYI